MADEHLDESIEVGQTGHISDHDVLHKRTNYTISRVIDSFGTEADRDQAIPYPDPGRTVYIHQMKQLTFWDGTRWEVVGTGSGGGGEHTVSDQPPVNPVYGEVWVNPGSTPGPFYLETDGGTMYGDIDMSDNAIKNVAMPSVLGDVANKAYVDGESGKNLPLSGGTLVGDLSIPGHTMTASAVVVDPQELGAWVTRNIWVGDSAPGNPGNGWIWLDSSLNEIKVWDGTQWSLIVGGTS